jgi:methyl-accepting chemotaxis protein
VSWRIVAGFALILGLVVVLAVVGIVALRNSRGAYGMALSQRQAVLEPALEAESLVQEANLQHLRFLVSPRQEFALAADSSAASARQLLERLRDTADVGRGSRTWAEALARMEVWNTLSLQADSLMRADRRAEANQFWRDRVYPARLAVRDVVERGVEVTMTASDSITASAERAARRMEQLMLVAAILALLLGGVSAWLLNRSITAPLKETTGVLASSAAEILAATTQQAAGARETSAAVMQTSTTVDEVSQTADHAAERARAVADSAQRAADIGKSGRRAVEESVAAMSGVKEQVESIADSILALAEQAQAIGAIISTVNEIAEQTNLLALNAAVEAARAGEQGRGFAVVAGEVRNLAARSKQATVQVSQILSEIQRATGTAVMTTERGTQHVAAGVRQVTEAGETIRTLVDAISESAQAAAQIVASAGQQAIGMTQIRQAMSNIQEATHQTLASTRQAEQAAADLNRIGVHLSALVGNDGERRLHRVPEPV